MNIDSVTQPICQGKIKEFFFYLEQHEQNLSKLEL